MAGKLYIVATPIGNLDDISERVKKTLSAVDIVAAEDTRRTGLLLSKLGIKKRMVSFFAGNENRKAAGILNDLKDGLSVALVSDAGTPLLSDPGFPLVKGAIDEGVEVVPIPGPSALLAALVVSGIPINQFTFVGYPPDKAGRRKKWLENLLRLDHAIVMYLSPWKVKFMLEDILDVLGNRPSCLCRELTKMHEEIIRGKLSEIAERIGKKKPKGEYVLVIANS